MKKILVFIVALLVATPTVAIIPEVKPVSPNEIPILKPGDDNPNYILPGQFMTDDAPAVDASSENDNDPGETGHSILDAIRVSTDTPLDMNWDADLGVKGVTLAPVIENTLFDILPYNLIQNLDIRYKLLRRVF